MTDRELLELAAKAAGIKVEWREVIRSRIAEFQTIKHTKHCGCYAGGKEWNPLTDDGDALRLAVKLKIGSILALQQWGNENMDDADSAYEQDPYAATRRAIVRAAAEIGKDI